VITLGWLGWVGEEWKGGGRGVEGRAGGGRGRRRRRRDGRAEGLECCSDSKMLLERAIEGVTDSASFSSIQVDLQLNRVSSPFSLELELADSLLALRVFLLIFSPSADISSSSEFLERPLSDLTFFPPSFAAPSGRPPLRNLRRSDWKGSGGSQHQGPLVDRSRV